MKGNLALCVAALALSACATPEKPAGTVDRMYVIPCGENHTNDVSRWTPGVNVGKPAQFSNNCYLIRHANGLMLWDSGNPDRLAALPSGLTNPQGTITAFMKKPLVESLKEIGVAPGDIRHFAMSHSHGDHSGNANLFAASIVYMQEPEYSAVFSTEPQKYGFIPANFEKLRGARFVRLNGDHDVFGDGSVVIKSAPGHTPGHQALLVRLAKRGPVLLTGDLVHLRYSWDNNVAPSFNYSVPQSLATIEAMKAFVKQQGAEVWINHDMQQGSAIPKAPAYIQ